VLLDGDDPHALAWREWEADEVDTARARSTGTACPR
jgi:hypothetical protein